MPRPRRPPNARIDLLSRADREPSTFAQGRKQVAQSQAYQNFSRIWSLLPPETRQPGTVEQPAPPLVYFGAKKVPLGKGVPKYAQSNRAHTFRQPNVGAGYRGDDYTGATIGLVEPAQAYARLGRFPFLVDKLLHETAHSAQAWPVVSAPLYAEGGADAFANALRGRAMGMFGVREPGDYFGYKPIHPFSSGPGYAAQAPYDLGTWFRKAYGRGMATRGQFMWGDNAGLRARLDRPRVPYETYRPPPPPRPVPPAQSFPYGFPYFTRGIRSRQR